MAINSNKLFQINRSENLFILFIFVESIVGLGEPIKPSLFKDGSHFIKFNSISSSVSSKSLDKGMVP